MIFHFRLPRIFRISFAFISFNLFKQAGSTSNRKVKVIVKACIHLGMSTS